MLVVRTVYNILSLVGQPDNLSIVTLFVTQCQNGYAQSNKTFTSASDSLSTTRFIPAITSHNFESNCPRDL